jgi:hypothetical protein
MGRRVKAFIGGVLRGVAAPGDVYVTNVYHYPHSSPEAAMRGDWARVGDELKRAMKRSDTQREDVQAAA